MPNRNGTVAGVRWGQVGATLACAAMLSAGMHLLEGEVAAARQNRETVGFPDAGAQRIEMIDELRSIGKKLDGIDKTVSTRLSSLEAEMSRMTAELERERVRAQRSKKSEKKETR